MSKALIVANWKCNPQTFKEAKDLQKSIEKYLSKSKKIKYYLAVPAVYFSELNYIRDINSVLGIQDIPALLNGPYTSSYTADMAASSGVEFTILNHSETKNAENFKTLADRVEAVLSTGMMCVLCIGELGRNNANYLEEINTELKIAISRVGVDQLYNLVIAYEPVWAIGNGKNATTDECIEAAISIRRTLADIYGMTHAKKIKLLYGGSVNEENAKRYVDEGGVDGLLIGHASLDAKKFAQIIKDCNS